MIDIEETEQDWDAARRRTVRTAGLTAVMGAVAIPAMAAPALWLTRLADGGRSSYLLIMGWMTVLCLPLVLTIFWLNDSQMRRSNRTVRRTGEHLRELLERAQEDSARQQVEAEQKQFETDLSSALEMAVGESEVLGVIGHAFGMVRPEDPVELLLADNSHAHLHRAVRWPGTGSGGGCPVDSPDHCPAARRGHTLRFADSDKLGACPKLREAGAARSAACVPVSIMGRTVGVIHAPGTVSEPVPDGDLARLNTVASLAGARLGMIRMVSEIELQATTDSLTGLLNRRAFETTLMSRRDLDMAVSLAIGDLDHFKELNDTYGHETGDRALRVFAQTLRQNVATTDLLGRHGGEEFVIAMLDCAPDSAVSILDALRTKIETCAANAGLPQFTASFGVVEMQPGEDLPSALARADRALFQAKHEGRNRVVHAAAEAGPGADRGRRPVAF